MVMKAGLSGTAELTVAWEDTAEAARSGDVPVLGTPRLIALCEQAAVEALHGTLGPGRTSVGARVEIAHLAAVAVGSQVRAAASLDRTEGRRMVFSVTVTDACGLVAAGKLTRVVVERDHFVAKAR